MNIIVTGAGKGIGFEICRLFLANADHKVVALSRDIASFNPLGEAHKGLIPIAFDLEQDDYHPLLARLPVPVDVLINNAGLLINKPFESTNRKDIERSFDVNFTAPYRLIQLLLPHFSPNAHVVNISSMGGYQGSAKFAGLSVYSASKSALACLTECLAEELKPRQVKVNCLCLGAVQTQMLHEAFPGYKAPVKPQEMAAYIVDFALKAHHLMNGKIIPVSLSTP